MRILHTADWHLGHTLRDHARTVEHAHFLRWLVAVVVERNVDAVLISGDVFERANPTPEAWRLWFEFLGDLKRARPRIHVVVIAGNHDSAQRLEAPRELLQAFDVRVIGQLRRDESGLLDFEDLLVPLRGAGGEVEAWCVGIPFLRQSDVLGLVEMASDHPSETAADPNGGAFASGETSGEASAETSGPVLIPRPVAAGSQATASEAGDPLIEGMRILHERVFAAARERRQPGQALVAMAHGYLVGGALSELSERKVLGGNQHALPVDLFPGDCAYVALGHLHRPQPLAGLEHVRYSGSPIPLSMPERLHAHHVVFCDLDGEGVEKIWSLRTPRIVDLLRLPERGELEPDEALAAVAALPERDPETLDEHRAFVEVAVRLREPSPAIAERIARAIADRDVRLVRVEVVLAERPDPIRSGGRPSELSALSVEQVFRQRYQRDYDGEVPAPLLKAFRELVEHVEHGELGDSSPAVSAPPVDKPAAGKRGGTP
ncbi:MAG: exonuclease SbcCD subunit D [Planctomycetota bacterium]